MASGQAKPLLRALARETLTRPPWWLMRQAGRYLPEYRAVRSQAHDFVELCLTPTLATELTLQPVRRYRMDGAILFSDILLIPHALGQKLTFREGEGPILEPIAMSRVSTRWSAFSSRAPSSFSQRRSRRALKSCSSSTLGRASCRNRRSDAGSSNRREPSS